MRPGFNGVPTDYLGWGSVANQSNAADGSDAASSGIGQVSGSDLIGAGGQDTGGGLVFLHSGEFTCRAVDLEICGRGFKWKMERTYRSALQFDGPLGCNWEFNYNRRLVLQSNGDVVRMDGYGRADRYVRSTGGFLPLAGFFTQLTLNEDGSYLERDRHGAKAYYSAPDPNGAAHLTVLRDRNGNHMWFDYNASGQLVRVLDTFGRAIRYFYNDDARLIEVRDFVDRAIRYLYDEQGNLTTVTGPAVTGTPTGNDFPGGKTGTYAYSKGFADPRLNHQLLSFTAPNEVATSGPPCLLCQYEVAANSADLGRIAQLTIGGTNHSGVPAGGALRFHYMRPAAAANDVNTRVYQTTVIDRNGNTAEYQFNPLGNTVNLRRYARGLRKGEPTYYESRYAYNRDGLLLSRVTPVGNTVTYAYDSDNPDRFQQGNLLRRVRTPDSARGGDQKVITQTMTYEPVYNQLLTYTSARGNDETYVPPNGGVASAARYTRTYTYDYQQGEDYAGLAAELHIAVAAVRVRLAAVPMNLGNVNADANSTSIQGNLIRIMRPAVTLLPGSNEADIEGSTSQPIVSLYSYNRFGQIISRTDPEQNTTVFSYYPSNNPSGDHTTFVAASGVGSFGYLSAAITDVKANPLRDSRTDPTPAAIRNDYFYDAVGNLIRSIDGRGIATEYTVNQLNQIVQITRAASHTQRDGAVPEPIDPTDFRYLFRVYYDDNNNVVRRQIEDRGDTSGTGGFVTSFFYYDILNRRLQVVKDVDGANTITRSYRYDGNGNRTLAVRAEGNATSYVYDERNLLFQTVIGTTTATSATLGAPAIASTRPGTPSTYTRNYDPNGNLIELVDAADNDGSAQNTSSIAGQGNVTRIGYDGFDRPTVVTDAVGSQSLCHYDPAGNLVTMTRSGTIGGVSPASNDTGNNKVLRMMEYDHDELNRVIQCDTHLFVASDIALVHPASIADGSLTPGDGNVTTRLEYDRNSRLAFVTDDNGNTTQVYHDGANRQTRVKDAENNVREFAYDGNGNTIETRSTDVLQNSAADSETFLTTFYYDTLNRLQRRVNNLGHTIESRYDSRNNLVGIADPNGPVSGSISRRAFPDGPRTVNTINGFGNVTVYSYDALNRRVRRDRVMTGSGLGEGSSMGVDIFGVKTPASADSNAVITVRYQWDGNSLLTALIDGNGNRTERTYDNHNRLIAEAKGGTAAPHLAGRFDATTIISYSYDADGNVLQVVDENGSIVTNRFDAVNRLTATDIKPGNGVVGTTAMTFEYDGCGRLTRATDDNDPQDPSSLSTITFSYDSLNRVIEEVQQIGVGAALAISSAWEGDSRRVGLTYPDGRVLTYAFDRLNRVTSISETATPLALATYSYIGRQRIAQRTYPQNKTTLTYLDEAGNDSGYDGLRRPIALSHKLGTRTFLGFAHRYDRANNPLSELKLHAKSQSELYNYDSLYRLVQFARGTLDTEQGAIVVPSALSPLQSSWAFDGAGNATQVDGETRQYNSFNEVVRRRSPTATTAMASDKNGNESNTGGLRLEYDHRNRLRNVFGFPDGHLLAVYSYDAINRRIRKVVTSPRAGDGQTTYCLDGCREIEERDGANQVVQQHIYGRHVDEHLILDRRTPGDVAASDKRRLFCHENRQHSVFALTDLSGKVVEGYQYEVYGTRTVFTPAASGDITFGNGGAVAVSSSSPLQNPHGFTGRRWDQESGLYYYRARYMASDLGRFITRDPIGFGGGSANLYEYVGGTPTRGLDPLGTGGVGSAVEWGKGKLINYAKQKFENWVCKQLNLTPESCENLKKMVDFGLEAGKAGELSLGQIYTLMKYDVQGWIQANDPSLQLAWANSLTCSNGQPLPCSGTPAGNGPVDGLQSTGSLGSNSINFSEGSTITGSSAPSAAGTAGISTSASNADPDEDDDDEYDDDDDDDEEEDDDEDDQSTDDSASSDGNSTGWCYVNPSSAALYGDAPACWSTPSGGDGGMPGDDDDTGGYVSAAELGLTAAMHGGCFGDGSTGGYVSAGLIAQYMSSHGGCFGDGSTVGYVSAALIAQYMSSHGGCFGDGTSSLGNLGAVMRVLNNPRLTASASLTRALFGMP